MPLNYAKWDQLELSDDSDIEGHPNVDKKSLIRWKQRDIHEKREARKFKIKSLEAQVACNNVLLPRIKEIKQKLDEAAAPADAITYYNGLVEKIKTNPSRDCPAGNDPSKIEQTYDGMMLSLLQQVSEKCKERIREAGVVESERTARLAKELAEEMQLHVTQLGATITKDQKELEKEIAEKNKRITSDDIHDGFETKYVPGPAAPPPLPTKPLKEKKKEKEKVTEIEVLNPSSSSSAVPNTTAGSAESDDEADDEEEEALPQMTPNLVAFSKLPIGDYEKSFRFIQEHRDVYVPGASDALLVAAFDTQSNGKPKYSKQCVHQSLLLQYCEKLGKDGVGLFFKKMITGDKRAMKIFVDDVDSTYQHIVKRVEITKQEATEGKEQIQLVAENPDTVITFNVPDGPPPENLVLEGPGTEDLDIEEVRKALQFRWDVFSGFPKKLQEALKDGRLERINQVLGDMDVADAEAVVQSLDMTGIMSFAEGGIRDETGRNKD